MKKLLVYIFLILVSCQYFEEPKITEKIEPKFTPQKELIDQMFDFKSCCYINHTLKKTQTDDFTNYGSHNTIEYIPELWGRAKVTREIITSDWRTVDRLLSAEMDELIVDPINAKEKLFSSSIQLVTLTYLYHFLNKEPATAETGIVMEKYLNILVRHSAVDLDLMADGLIQNREFIPGSNYEYIKDYILKTAISNRDKALAEIDNAVDKLNEVMESGAPQIWLYSDVKEMQQKANEAVYVIELLDPK